MRGNGEMLGSRSPGSSPLYLVRWSYTGSLEAMWSSMQAWCWRSPEPPLTTLTRARPNLEGRASTSVDLCKHGNMKGAMCIDPDTMCFCGPSAGALLVHWQAFQISWFESASFVVVARVFAPSGCNSRGTDWDMAGSKATCCLTAIPRCADMRLVRTSTSVNRTLGRHEDRLQVLGKVTIAKAVRHVVASSDLYCSPWI